VHALSIAYMNFPGEAFSRRGKPRGLVNPVAHDICSHGSTTAESKKPESFKVSSTKGDIMSITTLANTIDRYETPAIQLTEREISTSPIIWWVVLIIVLLALAATLALAVVIWCAIHGGGAVARWSINWNGTVTIGCSQ